MQYFITSSPFLSLLTASNSTAIIRCSTSTSRRTPCGGTPSRKIWARRAVPSIASITSSRFDASSWMSSRSRGVMKVRSRRFTTSCVTWSASCSSRFSAATCGVRRSGAASNRLLRCWAASLLRLATSVKRSKNSSLRGSRRTQSPGSEREKHRGPAKRPLGYQPHDSHAGSTPAGRVRPGYFAARRDRPRRRIDDRIRHLHRVGRYPAAGAFPGPVARGVGGLGYRDAVWRAVLRRAGGDVSEGGGELHLPPRGDLTAVRLPLRRDPVRRNSDRHDRRRGRRVRALHIGALAGAVTGDLPRPRHDAAFAAAV